MSGPFWTCTGVALACALGLAVPRPARAADGTPAPADSAGAVPAAEAPAPQAPPPEEGAAAVERGGRTTAAAPNPRLTGTRMVRIRRGDHNVVRSGPGPWFAIAAVVAEGRAFPVVARREDWYGVRLSATETGWVHASLCEEFDDLSDLEFRPNPRLYSRTGAYALGGYSGGYAFDRKSNSLVLGGRLGYYVFDRVRAEAAVAWTRVRRPQEVVESLFDLRLEEERFDMLFYRLGLEWELLPGRQMVPYLAAGAGSAILLGRSEPSVDVAAGTRLFLSRRTAMRWEVRDHRMRTGSDDARRTHHNIEFTLGTEFLF
jgi:outer membrane beta-barrel protein